jgi:hypothetical protein
MPDYDGGPQLPPLVSRPRAILVALVAATVAAAVLVPPAAAHPEPEGLDAFMRAVGQVESGGRYDAVNRTSGAYGKYQIMPFNWPRWAKAILGNANAPQSPQNQEKVARHRFVHLYHWLGSWPRVAYWWLTGKSGPVEQWSAYARRYVDKVMAQAGGMGWQPAAAGTRKGTGDLTGSATPRTTPPPRAPVHVGEGDPGVTLAGRWGRAAHAGYAGGAVAWSTSAGASASFTFTGRSISWVGPVGPTRGAARVYLDGVLVATVSQFARS